MKNFFLILDQNGERCLILLLYSMVVATISIEVIRRFGLSYSSLWGEEVARYAFIYLVWVACALGVRDRTHIRIDIILKFLPSKIVRCVYLFGDITSLIFAVTAAYLSIHPVLVSIKYGSMTHGLQISFAWFLAAVPLGFFIISVRLCQSIYRDWQSLRKGTDIFHGGEIFKE